MVWQFVEWRPTLNLVSYLLCTCWISQSIDKQASDAMQGYSNIWDFPKYQYSSVSPVDADMRQTGAYWSIVSTPDLSDEKLQETN